jgi:hypothetical protein
MQITDNTGNIIVCLILIIIVACAVYSIIKRKREGKSSCGCDCKNCITGCSVGKNETSGNDSDKTS